MNFSEEAKRLSAAIAIAICLLTADSVFVLRPLTVKYFEFKRKIRSVKEDLAAVEKQAPLLEEMKKKIEALRDEQGKFSKRLVKNDEVPFLISGLYKIASGSNVKIASVTPVQTDLPGVKQKAMYQETVLSISAAGGYRQIGRFIDKIEAHDKLMIIRDVDIVWNPAAPKSNTLTLSVCIYTSNNN